MRRILYSILVLLVLLVLSPKSVNALACSGTGYTCRQFDCAAGETEDTTRTCTLYDYICCKKIPTNPPAPTNPKPTTGASPTVTNAPTVTPAGVPCPTYPGSCQDFCNIPNCSSICINGYCYTTNLTAVPSSLYCNTYGNWNCLSGISTCAACASQNYQCEVRFCTNPPNSNQYQVNCGWINCSGGGGGGSNPTNTPTPTAFLRVRLFNPQLTPVTLQGINLCKVNCGVAPCNVISCQSNLNYYDFPRAGADQGGGLQYSNSEIIVLGITPYQNGTLSTINSYPACRSSTTTKNCASWSTAISTGNRVLRYIVITTTPSPTPIPAFTKLKNTSFYTNRSLSNPIPASPIAYDADDDASANFIIASVSSDPGLVSAASINLGSGQASAKSLAPGAMV